MFLHDNFLGRFFFYFSAPCLICCLVLFFCVSTRWMRIAFTPLEKSTVCWIVFFGKTFHIGIKKEKKLRQPLVWPFCHCRWFAFIFCSILFFSNKAKLMLLFIYLCVCYFFLLVYFHLIILFLILVVVFSGYASSAFGQCASKCVANGSFYFFFLLLKKHLNFFYSFRVLWEKHTQIKKKKRSNITEKMYAHTMARAHGVIGYNVAKWTQHDEVQWLSRTHPVRQAAASISLSW